MYSLNKIANEIRNYKLQKIIDSGENDMFDNKIDKRAVEQCLMQTEELIKEEKSTTQIDLNQTLKNINESKLFESIINLKDSHVG